MDINISPEGKARRVAAAARLIGKTQAQERQIERNKEYQKFLLNLKTQKELAEFNNQLQVDRLKFNTTMQIEREKRAQIWDLEKMELRSRLDFEREERQRQQKLDEYEQGVKFINERADRTDEWKQEALYSLQMKMLAGYTTPRESATPRAKVPTMENVGMLEELGYSQDEIRQVLNLPQPRTPEEETQPSAESEEQRVLYQRNPYTNQVRMSSDGGKTWQIIG